MSLLGLLEALWRRPDTHRPVAEEHLGVPLEVAHFEFSYAHLGRLFIVWEFHENVMRVQATMVKRRSKRMELVDDLGELN